MNTGQTFLALGALIMLSTMVLRFNRTILTSDEVMYSSKFNVLAASLATSLIDEAKSKAFDQKTDTAVVNDINQLSPQLKADGSETYATFNDFDDFNDYIRQDTTSIPGETFWVTSKVYYVESLNPIKITTNKTWHKMIVVTVINSTMKDPVKISSIYSYWYFR